jgi:WxL domain surface cell wall-binding
MSHSIRSTRKRLTALAGASVLIAGGGIAAVAFSAGTASAAACVDSGVAAGGATTCTVGGTATFTGGALSLEAPATMAWTTPGGLTGATTQVADAVGGADINQYEVVDSTGTGLGWTVTAAATTFTGTHTTPVDTLPDAAALSFDASDTDPTAVTPLSAVCSDGVTTDCVVPTVTDVTYPVVMDTAGPVGGYDIFDANAGTGVGDIVLGATPALPGTFWLTVPGTALADTYTSTITLVIASGPGGGTP